MKKKINKDFILLLEEKKKTIKDKEQENLKRQIKNIFIKIKDLENPKWSDAHLKATIKNSKNERYFQYILKLQQETIDDLNKISIKDHKEGISFLEIFKNGMGKKIDNIKDIFTEDLIFFYFSIGKPSMINVANLTSQQEKFIQEYFEYLKTNSINKKWLFNILEIDTSFSSFVKSYKKIKNKPLSIEKKKEMVFNLLSDFQENNQILIFILWVLSNFLNIKKLELETAKAREERLTTKEIYNLSEYGESFNEEVYLGQGFCDLLTQTKKEILSDILELTKADMLKFSLKKRLNILINQHEKLKRQKDWIYDFYLSYFLPEFKTIEIMLPRKLNLIERATNHMRFKNNHWIEVNDIIANFVLDLFLKENNELEYKRLFVGVVEILKTFKNEYKESPEDLIKFHLEYILNIVLFLIKNTNKKNKKALIQRTTNILNYINKYKISHLKQIDEINGFIESLKGNSLKV